MRIRKISTLGTFSSLCILFPLITSAQEVPSPAPTPRLVTGLINPEPPDKGLKNPFPTPTPASAVTVEKTVVTTSAVEAAATPVSASPMGDIPAAIEPPPVAVETTTSEIPAAIEPPIGGSASDALPDTATSELTTLPTNTPSFSGGVTTREFQGDELGQVLRLLARQSKIDLVVGETVQGTVTMRLQNKTALQAIEVIVRDKGLYMYEIDGTYFVKTASEKQKEPTDAGFYTFSYGRAEISAPLLGAQLLSGIAPQVDPRTNTIFYREFKSNMNVIAAFLEMVDKPTRQVMIEARLVEVNANPKQAYGLNWGGVVGSSSTPQTIRYAGSSPATDSTPAQGEFNDVTGTLRPRDFFLDANQGRFLNALAGQFAILSLPQMSVTLRLLNEDTDAEFLANPRIVTADNQEATIKIVRSQPVPQLNFNEQTATAVFGGFENKEYGNKLVVRPAINKDDFISLSVKPEISNKVSDAQFTIGGATVFSPIIDTRTLESNVLIKSGDTLAIGGLLQDETTKQRTKVPILGDIPGLGYLFQEKLNAKTKRNLLVFVTPTIIQQGYGTGLEDQVNGLTNSGEEYADPNGWRNNAKGSIRVIPTSNRSSAANIAAPGVAKQPRRIKTKTISTSVK